jgi:hypothetical protein
MCGFLWRWLGHGEAFDKETLARFRGGWGDNGLGSGISIWSLEFFFLVFLCIWFESARVLLFSGRVGSMVVAWLWGAGIAGSDAACYLSTYLWLDRW